MAFFSRIVFHFGAIGVQFRPGASSIFKTVQVDLHARPVQATYLVKRIDYPAVIRRVRNVHAHDM
jgi:hypothetical protein